MFPPSMPRLVLRPEDSLPDPSHALEQHVLSGFPPDLALDLVLNELVVRAAEATRASAAALALVRGNENEMVCRAATGQLAPGLGGEKLQYEPAFPRMTAGCRNKNVPAIYAEVSVTPRGLAP